MSHIPVGQQRKVVGIALAVALAASSFGARADVTVDSIVATGSYQLGAEPVNSLISSGPPSVDVLSFPSSSTGDFAGLHSYGSVSGNFGSRSSGSGIYDVTGSFSIAETITNTTAGAQHATFNFFITPGLISNEIGTALTGSNYVSSGLTFDVKLNGSSIWGSSAVLTSNAGGTSFAATGDTAMYSGGGTYYAVNGISRSIDLGVLDAGESISLSYDLTSFAKGISAVGPDSYVPEVTYWVPDQWVDSCWGECGAENPILELVPGHWVTVPAHVIPGTISGSHASSGDPFDIDFGTGQANFLSQPGAAPYGANVTFTAAVPEPSEYAMLLAGLGLVGWAARRRRAAASSGNI